MKNNKFLPKISLVTVCYNSEKTIAKTFESVKAQNYPALEYIVIDGASTDGTLKLIKQYDSIIGRFVSEPDNGIYDAMNKGARLATGDYIGFINSDDYLTEGALWAEAKEIQKSAPDVVYGDLVLKYADGSEKVEKYGQKSLYNFYFKMAIPHAATLVKQSWCHCLPFDLNYKIAADYNFFLKLYDAGASFAHIPKILAHYSMNGASGTRNWLTLKETEKIAETRLYNLQQKAREIYQNNRWWHIMTFILKRYGKLRAIVRPPTENKIKYQIFGTGDVGEVCYQLSLHLGVKIDCFIDNDKEKQGKKKYNLPIVSLEDAVKRNNDDKSLILIAMTKNNDEIKEQLFSFEKVAGEDFFEMKDWCAFVLNEFLQNINWVGVKRVTK